MCSTRSSETHRTICGLHVARVRSSDVRCCDHRRRPYHVCLSSPFSSSRVSVRVTLRNHRGAPPASPWHVSRCSRVRRARATCRPCLSPMPTSWSRSADIEPSPRRDALSDTSSTFSARSVHLTSKAGRFASTSRSARVLIVHYAYARHRVRARRSSVVSGVVDRCESRASRSDTTGSRPVASTAAPCHPRLQSGLDELCAGREQPLRPAAQSRMPPDVAPTCRRVNHRLFVAPVGVQPPPA